MVLSKKLFPFLKRLTKVLKNSPNLCALRILRRLCFRALMAFFICCILAQSKIFHYLCNRILRWREYVLRKVFRNGSFLGRFRTY
jgi:hypothetical protein